MPWTDRQEIRLFFEDTGSGHAIVLLHSFLCSREMWRFQADELARSYRIVNVDLRGHGDSGPVEEPITIQDLVDDVVTILDDVGVERAVWAGLSLGGMIAMHAGLMVPDRVDALIIADSSAERDPLRVRVEYRLLALVARWAGIDPVLGQVTRLMFGATTRRREPALVAEWRQRFGAVHVPSILALLDGLNRRPSILGQLGSLRLPALVIVGEEDATLPPRRSRAIAAAIPGAELVVIPEAGHLTALEQPGAVTAAMRDFLHRVAPS